MVGKCFTQPDACFQLAVSIQCLFLEMRKMTNPFSELGLPILFTLINLEITTSRYQCWMTSSMFHVSKKSNDLGGFLTGNNRHLSICYLC